RQHADPGARRVPLRRLRARRPPAAAGLRRADDPDRSAALSVLSGSRLAARPVARWRADHRPPRRARGGAAARQPVRGDPASPNPTRPMTERIRRLVAGVGTLQEMDPVIPAAAALAADAGLPLELVHAFDVSDPFVAAYLESAVLPGDPLRRYAEGVQARMEGQVGGLNARGEVRCHA